jgi:glycosyltransferase involved in cell wall biosynthesis
MSASHPISKFDLLSDADIFLFPPREPEGHPWVIIEAMAASLPIISTDQGAIIESVIDGSNGFIVPPFQPDIIADKIKLLVSDPILRKKMGAESLNYYKKEFTEERMVEKLTNIFNTVINK